MESGFSGPADERRKSNANMEKKNSVELPQKCELVFV